MNVLRHQLEFNADTEDINSSQDIDAYFDEHCPDATIEDKIWALFKRMGMVNADGTIAVTALSAPTDEELTPEQLECGLYSAAKEVFVLGDWQYAD